MTTQITLRLIPLLCVIALEGVSVKLQLTVLMSMRATDLETA